MAVISKRKAAIELLQFCETFKQMHGTKGVSSDELALRQQSYELIIAYNNGVVKSPLMDLEPLPDNAGGNKAEAAKACTVNAVSEETPKGDAVL